MATVLCFKKGCPKAANEAGGQDIVYHIGTQGQIGGSEAKLTLPFCSKECRNAFEEKYPTAQEKLRAVARMAV